MSQAGANSSSGSVSTTITITGNDANPQTASAFTIVGVDNFLFDWSVVDSEFQISPPNSLIWGANSNSTTSGTLIAGNSNYNKLDNQQRILLFLGYVQRLSI